MSRNRLFDAIMAVAILAVVGFTIQFTAAPSPVVSSSATISGGQMTGTYLPQGGIANINGALMTGTYLPQSAMTTSTGPQMTGTYLPQGGIANINGALMTGTYLPQTAMQPNSY